MLSYIKRPSVYIGGVILLALGALYAATLSPKTEEETVAAITRKDLVREVFITGSVKASQAASLSFDRGGKIIAVSVSTDKPVPAGTILARLESGAEEAALAEASAEAASAKAALEKVRRGTRPEEIRVKEAGLATAETALMNLREKTPTVIADSYNQAEVALNRLVDPLFSNDESNNPRLTFSNGNQSGVYQAETERIVAGNSLRELKKLTASESGDGEENLAASLRHLRSIQSLFLTVGEILTSASGLSDALLADYKERVGTARGSATTAMAAIQNHKNALREAASAFTKAERELELVQAAADEGDIRTAEETVRQREARLAGARAAIEKTLLRAPFPGRAVPQNIAAGETVSAGETVLEFLGTDSFIIEAQVPEADIAKIENGDGAVVTLDAYGDAALFAARVVRIESAPKEIEGVPTYKTVFAFEKRDARFRSGLTANITVTEVLKKDALVAPAQAVVSEDGESFIRKKMPNGSRARVPVTLGIRPNAREVEILEGAGEGDLLILQAVR